MNGLNSCTLVVYLSIEYLSRKVPRHVHSCTDYHSGSNSNIFTDTTSHLGRSFLDSLGGQLPARAGYNITTCTRRSYETTEVVIATMKPFFDQNTVNSALSKVTGQAH